MVQQGVQILPGVEHPNTFVQLVVVHLAVMHIMRKMHRNMPF